MTEPSAFQRFTGELRRRHVPQTAAVYLVAAWAAIEFADIVVPNLNGPQWAVTAVIVAAGVGFPVVLILAWIFDWGPEGVHRTEPEPGEGEAGRGGAAGTPAAAPWMAAVGVLVVGIGSALVVAALLANGAGADRAEPVGDRRPAPPPVLVPPDFAGDLDSLRGSVGRDLRDLRGLGRIEDVDMFGGLDTMDLSELVDVALEVAEEAGLSLLIQEPGEWNVGRREPAPLAEGDTLVIRGLARDTAGVVSVTVDGETVARSTEPEEILRFTARITGTGDEGIRTVVFVVRTGDDREIRREYPVTQRPPARPSGAS